MGRLHVQTCHEPQSVLQEDAGKDSSDGNSGHPLIFICPFAILDGNRHLHTFRNVCMEDRETVMPDGAAKILLSTKGTMDDVASDMKAFLEYVDGKMVEDDFVQEIDQEIRNIKSQEQERVSYMTYAMKIQEERDEARAEGRAEGKTEMVIEMLKAKQPLDFIARISNFSNEKISEIGRLHGDSKRKSEPRNKRNNRRCFESKTGIAEGKTASAMPIFH